MGIRYESAPGLMAAKKMLSPMKIEIASHPIICTDKMPQNIYHDQRAVLVGMMNQSFAPISHQ